MLKKFTADQINYLKYYVYIYMDPDTREIFYVGKGKGNRVFAHLSEEKISDKTNKISDIKLRGKEPIIEILIHGLEDEETALKVESAVIDLIGLGNLTNIVKGHNSNLYGRLTLDQLIQRYQNEVANIEEPSLLIRINQVFKYGMTAQELYDATRARWKIGYDRDKVEYAFAIYDGVIQEVYKVAAWFKAGETYVDLSRFDGGDDRWEFVGSLAEADIREKYLNKSVTHLFRKGDQNPFKYVNIK